MTTTLVRFDEIAPSTPDLEALAGETRTLLDGLAAADTLETCRPHLERWNALRREVDSYDAFVDLRFSQDTRAEDRKAAREAWDDAKPRWTELLVDVKRALLAHPLRGALEDDLGAQAFALWESEVLSFDAALKPDLSAESKLTAVYTELRAGAELPFRGETYNLSTILKFRQSADRATRQEAEQVLWGWFGANRAELDRIYGELVDLRHGMARKLGLPSFVELGYKRMCRVDYDRGDVERFRRTIRQDVVPLAAELNARKQRTLGVERLMAWDEPVHDLSGNPKPQGDRAWMVGQAQEMFRELGGGLDDFFHRMDAGGFLDLDARQGKAGGGFCTAFPTHGMPYVFANFNGTKGDVEVLTHEIGHAFQCYSSRDLWPCDYLWATYESCEIHSMSLEFLTYPQMERFFGDDADRFRRIHMAEAIEFLPYGTAVDHFQHLVYERPDATPEERHAMWKQMEETYLPWRDWGDLAHPAGGGRWQAQSHVYCDPFYYIDYVLAQTCALQLWAAAEEDRPAAMETYVALCRRGGSAPFQALVRGAGLTSPFDEGCLSSVVDRARGLLEL